MILTVNLGNTHITIGGYEHDDLKFCGRLHTDPAESAFAPRRFARTN